MDLCETPDSGMYHADVVNVNKQDDGAAHFHTIKLFHGKTWKNKPYTTHYIKNTILQSFTPLFSEIR